MIEFDGRVLGNNSRDLLEINQCDSWGREWDISVKLSAESMIRNAPDCLELYRDDKGLFIAWCGDVWTGGRSVVLKWPLARIFYNYGEWCLEDFQELKPGDLEMLLYSIDAESQGTCWMPKLRHRGSGSPMEIDLMQRVGLVDGCDAPWCPIFDWDKGKNVKIPPNPYARSGKYGLKPLPKMEDIDWLEDPQVDLALSPREKAEWQRQYILRTEEIRMAGSSVRHRRVRCAATWDTDEFEKWCAELQFEEGRLWAAELEIDRWLLETLGPKWQKFLDWERDVKIVEDQERTLAAQRRVEATLQRQRRKLNKTAKAADSLRRLRNLLENPAQRHPDALKW